MKRETESAGMRTYDLTLCTSPDGWSLHAPGVSDEQLASGDAPYLVSGEGEPGPADYHEAAMVAADRAAECIDASKDGDGWTYHDDADGKDYLCDSLDDMVRLFALMSSPDPDVSRDAYSFWCAETSHAEIEGWEMNAKGSKIHWIRFLPEVGTLVRRYAERIEELSEQLERLDLDRRRVFAEMSALNEIAEKEAAKEYTEEEIKRARDYSNIDPSASRATSDTRHGGKGI